MDLPTFLDSITTQRRWLVNAKWEHQTVTLVLSSLSAQTGLELEVTGYHRIHMGKDFCVPSFSNEELLLEYVC